MFNYTSDADKQWFDHITPYSADNQKGSVQLVSYDHYKGTWNYNLEFTKGKTNHAGNTVATLTIKANQDNFPFQRPLLCPRNLYRCSRRNFLNTGSDSICKCRDSTLGLREKPESGKTCILR